MTRVNTALKAIYAAASAALTGVGVALVQAHTFGSIDDATWISIAILTLGAGGAVYGVTNSTPAAGSGGSS
jgi:hypothetical protein